jgi:hypothetical protein
VGRQKPGVSSNIQMKVPDTQKVREQQNITLQNMNGAAYCTNAVLAKLNESHS